MLISHRSPSKHHWHYVDDKNGACEDDNELSVLLVEDDYGDTLLTLQALNSVVQSYDLDRIDHGDEVLPYLATAAQNKLPDVILLDMGLPGTDGFEILETLALSPALMRSAPIVIITMHSNFEYIQKTYDLPIYGYLTKPVKPKDLRTVLSKIAGFVSRA
jgi:response regulator RpfG family c-di-GMP phosphodiesterase